MKKRLTLFLAIVMLLTLSACGGGKNEKAIVGTWELWTLKRKLNTASA